jgi:hypothetical protein
MAENPATPPQKEPPGPAEKIIRIFINVQGTGEGQEVIIAQGSSNHYTDHSFKSDTCCTCET